MKFACFFVASFMIFLKASGKEAANGKVDFNRDVRPVLSDNCFHCHGFDAKKRKADLRLDVPEGALKPNKEGVAPIKPRDLSASEVWKRITTADEDDVMPPPDTHKKLTEAQRSILKRWIEQGAEYQPHWAFITPALPAVPPVKTANPIDAFILARLKEEGLRPQPEADKETLIRRVTMDLTGLPPTIAEVDAYLTDSSPLAYEHVVERLLKSPAYGEHMARYWLDLARYGDTHGLHLDNERSMWPYRDWVVKAFNDNLGFDKFTTWQLAGDLLPNATREQQIASGFNRCNVTTSEGGSINAEFTFRYAVDRTATAAGVWMGLTAGCCVCHDHKFDPITQKEFYSMYAFFNSAADPAMDGNKSDTPPVLKLTTEEQETKLKGYDVKLAELDKTIKTTLAGFAYNDPATIDPKPPKKETETVWVDDSFPADATVAHSGTNPLQWVTEAEGKVLSGKRAVMRKDAGLAQDFFNGMKQPFVMPAGAKLFVNVYLEPSDLPKAVMIQFHTNTWSHRAVWGDVDAISFGAKDTVERLSMGALPKAGQWVQLAIPADKLKLAAGTKISGLAFTQFGGTVYWDKAGVTSVVDPVNDPAESQLAWEKQWQGKANKDFPADIQQILRSVKPADRKPDQNEKLKSYWVEFVSNDGRKLLQAMHDEKAPVEKAKKDIESAIPVTLMMRDMDKPRDSFVMVRGQYDKPGDAVTRGVPAFLPALPKKEGDYTRLDFANWLVDRKHPLTSRVAVNRFWQQFFGTGLVKTSADFGAQGEPPSHPELLDWLAVTFIESGWDMKALARSMVTSATYRQESVQAAGSTVDPENRLYSRGPRFRFDAEVIRDNALFLSGLLDPTVGGKAVKTYQPPNIWEPVGFGGSNTREYKQDHGNALYRRSIYMFLKRTAPPPILATFDAPSREQFCTRRERSDTPLQALDLMNDVQYFEAARNFAQRMILEGGRTPDERITWAWRSALSRRPTASELDIAKGAFEKHLAKYQADPQAAKDTITYGESKPDEKLNASELAAYTMIANLLINLDETVTKN